MTAAVFGILLSFITAMFLVNTQYTEWMWWPILFSFSCLAVLHTIPAVQKAMTPEDGDVKGKKKWLAIAKLVGPYFAAVILSALAGALGFTSSMSDSLESNAELSDEKARLEMLLYENGISPDSLPEGWDE